MALFNKTDGLITAVSTYSSSQGTLRLEFSPLVAGGDNHTIDINLAKLAQGISFGIRSSGTGFEGHRFLGSSYGITGTATTNNSIIQGGESGEIQTVTGGIGKVNILTRAALGDTRPAEYAEVNAKDIIGRTIRATDVIQQGAILFTNTTGTQTASTVFSRHSQPGTGIFRGGNGTAILTKAADTEFSSTIRLNEVNYPFTTVTGDAIELVGNSILYR